MWGEGTVLGMCDVVGEGNTNNHLAFESILPTVSMVSEVRGIAKPNWFMESNLDWALIVVTSTFNVTDLHEFRKGL